MPYLPKGLVWQFSKRYVAGETMEDAIKISRQLNAGNMRVTVDLLGEFITDLNQARQNTDMYLQMIDHFQLAGIDCSFSLKPTSFGLLLDEEVCYKNIRSIVEAAASFDFFVRIDMEDSSCTEIEIRLFQRLQKEFPGNVAIVVQAYLRRTMQDIQSMLKNNASTAPINFRLCKGIYVEPEKIAYKDYNEVRKHFVEDLEYMLSNNAFAAIATHDKFLVDEALRLLEKYHVSKNQYEFQMLYGVTPHLRDEIVVTGHPMRIYVPFGKDWFAYCTRRIKENPKIAGDVLKALFVKN